MEIILSLVLTLIFEIGVPAFIIYCIVKVLKTAKHKEELKKKEDENKGCEFDGCFHNLEPEKKKKYCDYCGAVIPDDARKCHSCGAKIKKD